MVWSELGRPALPCEGNCSDNGRALVLDVATQVCKSSPLADKIVDQQNIATSERPVKNRRESQPVVAVGLGVGHTVKLDDSVLQFQV